MDLWGLEMEKRGSRGIGMEVWGLELQLQSEPRASVFGLRAAFLQRGYF